MIQTTRIAGLNGEWEVHVTGLTSQEAAAVAGGVSNLIVARGDAAVWEARGDGLARCRAGHVIASSTSPCPRCEIVSRQEETTRRIEEEKREAARPRNRFSGLDIA